MHKTKTKDFLSVIDVMFPNHSVYHMDLLSGKKSTPRITTKEEAHKRNDIKEKHEIYYTPNGEYALANHERKKKNAKRMFCVFVEIDFDTPDAKKKLREGFDFEPSLVIETYKGYHVYWLIEPISYESEGNIWDETQEMLCSFFGADKMAKDAARILRLPGHTYRKNGVGDTQIEVREFHPLNIYSIKDFITYFQPYSDLKKQEQIKLSKFKGNTFDTVQKINTLCDVRDVLHSLSINREVQPNGDIYEGGQKTDGYKYRAEENALNCFSPHDNRPKGGPFSVAKHIIGNNYETFKYFEKNYNIAAPRYIEDETTHIVKEDNVKIDFDGGMIDIDRKTGVTKAITQGKNGDTTKLMMSGALRPLGYFMKPGEEKNNYVVEYKNKQGRKGILILKQLGKAAELKTQLGNIGINLFMNNNSKAVQEFIQYLYGVNNEYHYLDYAGNIGGGKYIYKTGQYILQEEDTHYFVDIDKTGSENGIMIHLKDSVNLDVVKRNIDLLMSTYEERIVASAALWYMMSLFITEIRAKFKFFPILNLVGESQAGKTTMRRLMMHIIGVSQDMEVQAAATEFAIMKMCTHSLPLNVGEFENADRMYVDWDVFLKNNFDGTRNLRGTASQKLLTYPNRASICIDGELRSMNNAVYTRSVMLMMTKYMRKKEVYTFELDVLNGYFRDNYAKINNITSVFREKVDEYHHVLKDVSAAEKGRMINNYALLDAFSQCFSIMNATPYLMEQIKSQIENMGDNTLERTIKKIFVIAYQQNFAAYIRESDNTVVIETAFDTLRFSSAKIDELRSHIQIVNHHFNPHGVNSEDDLAVPIDYIMKNKKLYNAFVKILNYISRTRMLPNSKIIGAIKEFAKNNKFTTEAFYDSISWDAASFTSNKKDVKKGDENF